MHFAWTRNLSGEAKEQRKAQVMSYNTAFEELRKILETDFLKKEADRDYSAGWEHRHIAINEYNAALADILKLINIKG